MELDSLRNAANLPLVARVDGRDQVLKALAMASELGRPLTLVSTPAAALAQGPGWFPALCRQLLAFHDTGPVRVILDCDDAAGLALAALRLGVAGVRVRLGPEALARLAAIAAAMGRTVEHQDTPIDLDLTGQSPTARRVLPLWCRPPSS